MSDIWFDGPIAEAISLVAEKQCVFLVYIHDESEKTNTLNDTLKDEQVTKAIRESTVAVAMERNSENAALFGQYYPIQAVPILYFIKQGTIRDFGIETLTSQEIIDKINAVNQISTVPAQQPASVAPATPVPAPQPPANDTTHTVDTASTSNTDTTRKAEQNDEINAKKAEQEAKMLQEAQQSRVDKENKIYFEKIKKERQEDEAHKKKVREQIARDRAEKIAQRNAEKQRQNSTLSSTTLLAEEGTSSSSSLSNSSSHHVYSNLNIRQLDGSNIRHQFEAASTLSEVRHWIQENRTEDAKKPYKLSSQFPTRLFTEADDATTLKDLNLCPSATIIMKPLKAGSSSVRSAISGGNNGGVTGYIYSAFDFVYGVVIALINLLTGLLATLFPTNGMSPADVPASQHQQPLIRNMRGGQRLGGEGVSAESSATASSSAAQKRNPYATRVNTLHDEDDSEDEDKRSTYNGNSVNHE
ncbi:hypothetical protein FB192DRAFT_1270770 [Mucor lusitanicus]|uniref:UBX domain-containing protein 2 n=1 Tax=Mucor circinelloides f. lusitanicus TaxID=29924 RepID=A0A8H4BU95_MUCCL|nr:hypothetical protein FB192DRAFT_1270770 [Mucor lusitanicus]